jgi:NADH-quinone oxidoreductase subunit N
MSYIILPIFLNSIDGIIAAIIYLIVYILLTINIFSVLLCCQYYVSSNYVGLTKIIDVVPILKSNWLLAFSFACSLMSMAGIPPFAGFFAKLLVFQALVQTGNFMTLILLIILSIVGSIYYIRLIRFLFFNNAESIPYGLNFYLNNKFLYIIILITFIINVNFFFFFPSILEWLLLIFYA